MKKSLYIRAHEWAADNFKFVQYPNISQVQNEPIRKSMPFWKRYFLFVFGIAGLLISLVLIFAIFLIIYSVFTA